MSLLPKVSLFFLFLNQTRAKKVLFIEKFIPVTLLLGGQGDTCTIQVSPWLVCDLNKTFTVHSSTEATVCHISQVYIYLHLLAKVVKCLLLLKQEFTNHVVWMSRELPWVTEHIRDDRNHFCNELQSSSQTKHHQESLPEVTLQPSQHSAGLYTHTHIHFKHSQDQERKLQTTRNKV